jgi:hypothetical protein
MGRYYRKVTKNLGQSAFLSACEIEHGHFRALFAGIFWLRYRMVGVCQKPARFYPRFTTEDTEATE